MSQAGIFRRKITWIQFEQCVEELVLRLDSAGRLKEGAKLYGIPTGGAMVAQKLRELAFESHDIRLVMVEDSTDADVVVDDLVASGRTYKEYRGRGGDWHFDCLYRKPFAPDDIAPHALSEFVWIVFPWESEVGPEDSMSRVLEYVGEDPTRDGLVETPGRYLRGLKEMTSGYGDDPESILSKRFDQEGVNYDSMVVVSGMEFWSLCEHHLLPFHGTATVGYIPGEDGKIVGLSKLARLTHCFARRLQVQERLTEQIAGSIDHHLSPKGVGVTIKARHQCMEMRGCRTAGVTVTNCLLGNFRDGVVRAEFIALGNEP